MFKSVIALSFFFAIIAGHVVIAQSQAPQCGDETWLLREIEGLLGRPSNSLTVADLPFRIETPANTSAGRFALVLTQGSVLRHLEAASCEEVYRAAALVAAVAIDPTFEPDEPLPSSDQESVPQPLPVTAEPEEPLSEPRETRNDQIGAELTVGGMWGPQPDVALVTRLGAFVRMGVIRLGIAGLVGAPSTRDATFGGVQIWSWGGALYGSWQLEVHSQWSIGLGAGFEAGELRAQGRVAEGATSRGAAFLRVGLRSTLEWRIAESAALSLIAQGGPAVLRPKFLLNNLVVFQAEPLFVDVGLQVIWFF